VRCPTVFDGFAGLSARSAGAGFVGLARLSACSAAGVTDALYPVAVPAEFHHAVSTAAPAATASVRHRIGAPRNAASNSLAQRPLRHRKPGRRAIIEQDVARVRVDHRHSVDDLARLVWAPTLSARCINPRSRQHRAVPRFSGRPVEPPQAVFGTRASAFRLGLSHGRPRTRRGH
jgi:hypothetical protein